MSRKKLGVNVDHFATLRQARGTSYPDPVQAALMCQEAGADSIVAHLREDRRHIQDRDVFGIKAALGIMFNLEMSIAKPIVDIAVGLKPDQATLVPERRQELTTEGGLNAASGGKRLKSAVSRLISAGIEVSLFIEPAAEQIKASIDIGVGIIELHTGMYAEAKTKRERVRELRRIVRASEFAVKSGLIVNAGHGLHYENVGDIAAIEEINELNIGHSIVSYAAFYGIKKAVKDMKKAIRRS